MRWSSEYASVRRQRMPCRIGWPHEVKIDGYYVKPCARPGVKLRLSCTDAFAASVVLEVAAGRRPAR